MSTFLAEQFKWSQWKIRNILKNINNNTTTSLKKEDLVRTRAVFKQSFPVATEVLYNEATATG